MLDSEQKAIEIEKLEAELRLKCHQMTGRIYNSLSIIKLIQEELEKETISPESSNALESLKKTADIAVDKMTAVGQLEKKGSLKEALAAVTEIYKIVSSCANESARMRLEIHSHINN